MSPAPPSKVVETPNGYILNYHYATIKYSPKGRRLWVQRYNRPRSNSGIAKAMAVDGQGNVYVTGEAWFNAWHSSYLTIKYKADGKFLWESLHGPGKLDNNPTSIAVDSQGNVYVTGSSNLGSMEDVQTEDYLTLKYDTDGTLLWEARYSGGGAMALALDNQDRVYVTGWAWYDFLQ